MEQFSNLLSQMLMRYFIVHTNSLLFHLHRRTKVAELSGRTSPSFHVKREFERRIVTQLPHHVVWQ